MEDLKKLNYLASHLETKIHAPNEILHDGTPLHLAVAINQKDVVKFLLDEGADIEAKNFLSDTPLLVAVFLA